MEVKMRSLEGIDLRGKKVLLRPDINSPVDPVTKKIVNDNRIVKTIPVIKELLDKGAGIAIIAHQGDTLDYQNLVDLHEHAERLTELLGQPVEYIDDVCGPAAIARVESLKAGEVVILGNLRYLTEEVSTFEKDVKQTAEEYTHCWEVRKLAPLFDFYVNEAFSAAHRNSPSMVAFQELLPTAAGPLLFKEYEALYNVLHNAEKPCVFVLGGAKISDAYGMMRPVLENGTADAILTTGVTGLVMLYANGVNIGEKTIEFLKNKDLLGFVDDSKRFLAEFPGKITFISVCFAFDGFTKEALRIRTYLIQHLIHRLMPYSSVQIDDIILPVPFSASKRSIVTSTVRSIHMRYAVSQKRHIICKPRSSLEDDLTRSNVLQLIICSKQTRSHT